MYPNMTAAQVAADLHAIREWCSDNSTDEIPPAAIAYLDANHALLKCLIRQVESYAGREHLQAQHQELDFSVVHPSFFPIAREAAIDAVRIMAGDRLSTVSDDDVHMTLRAVEYAKYLPSSECGHVMMLSPVRLPK